MNNRVFTIRKHFGLSQEKFGDKIGVTGAAVSRLESGDRAITDSTIKLICTTFNINENWFRTGEGEMFNNNVDDELYYLIGALMAEDDPYKKRFIKTMLKLSSEQWEQVKNFAKLLSTEED